MLLLVTAPLCGVMQRVSRLGVAESRLKPRRSDGSKKEAQVRCTCTRSKSTYGRLAWHDAPICHLSIYRLTTRQAEESQTPE